MKYLPESGENLFQGIKRLIREYESVNGEGSSINIAVGEPDTNPPELLRKIVADEVLRDDNANHTYWDNRSPEGLNRKLIMQNCGVDIDDFSYLDSLLIPGEKSMIGLLPIACGANRTDSNYKNKGYIVNAPAYDLISTWSEYLGEENYIWPIYSYDDFKLKISNIPEGRKPKMILTVKPGNPAPVGATRNEWDELINYCIDHNIRLVNDGAYTSVVHKNHVSLSEVAKDYPELDWIEFFSISKALSACGWRMGVAFGNKDFVSELTKIKGNSDSGAFGPAIVGLNKYLDNPQSKEDMKNIQEMYKRRLDILIPIFQEAGLQLSCPTDAGFFMLFKCPNKLDGEPIKSGADFNNAMINKVGLVGVPFVGSDIDGIREQFIRYSACYDANDSKKIDILKEALSKVKIEY